MSPKERRDRLFKSGRPQARRLEILDGEQYSKDIGILWANYEQGGFETLPRDLDHRGFADAMEQIAGSFESVWVIEDHNGSFKSGRGPVAVVGTRVNSLVVTVEGTSFKWATKRNILRASVAILLMLRASRKVGVIFATVKKELTKAAQHLGEYDALYYVGRTGDNDYLFSIRGKA